MSLPSKFQTSAQMSFLVAGMSLSLGDTYYTFASVQALKITLKRVKVEKDGLSSNPLDEHHRLMASLNITPNPDSNYRAEDRDINNHYAGPLTDSDYLLVAQRQLYQTTMPASAGSAPAPATKEERDFLHVSNKFYRTTFESFPLESYFAKNEIEASILKRVKQVSKLSVDGNYLSLETIYQQKLNEDLKGIKKTVKDTLDNAKNYLLEEIAMFKQTIQNEFWNYPEVLDSLNIKLKEIILVEGKNIENVIADEVKKDFNRKLQSLD